jgi:L-aminopeptidase/D-esterase-like protein
MYVTFFSSPNNMENGIHNAITDVAGIKVGHYTDLVNGTGCTVVLCPAEGAVGGVDVRGPAPATRETELLRTGRLVERVNAILLTGGSAFGLDAASGVMRFLEDRDIGFDVGVAHVPIVPVAAIFDLAVGNPGIRPTADAGYQSCLIAGSGAVAEGTVGAGTGASVGHMLGIGYATKGGVGTASRKLEEGVTIGALVVVNAYGDVVDPHNGEIIAGTRKPEGGWLDSAAALMKETGPSAFASSHTTIGVVATDAELTKEEANLVAMMAHDGLARAIRPVHTLYDGDALFVLSAGKKSRNLSAIGHAASVVVAEAIVRSVDAASSILGIPARRDLK